MRSSSASGLVPRISFLFANPNRSMIYAFDTTHRTDVVRVYVF